LSDAAGQRLEAAKATQAACSVMLALAAYNSGPAKVKAAVRKVSDPIKQRNFRYLYRVRAVPPEARA
jgi:hypothetical protein